MRFFLPLFLIFFSHYSFSAITCEGVVGPPTYSGTVDCTIPYGDPNVLSCPVSGGTKCLWGVANCPEGTVKTSNNECYPPCPSGDIASAGGSCPCPDGSPPDLFGRCAPECPEGQVYDDATEACYPSCEDGTLNCCDSVNPPPNCPNPPPCDDLTDPECAPDPDPDCPEGQVWDGSTCVNTGGNSSGNNSSGGGSSEGSSEGGDSGEGNNGGDGGNNGGTNSSEGGSGSSSGGTGGSGSEGSNTSEGSTYTGSGDCSVPPQCEAGEPECELLKQQFEQHCKLIEYTSEPLYEGEEGEQEGQITEAYNDFKSRIEAAPIVNSIETFFSMPASSGGCPTYSVDIWFASFTFDHWCASWIPWSLISGILLAVSIFIAARIALT